MKLEIGSWKFVLSGWMLAGLVAGCHHKAPPQTVVRIVEPGPEVRIPIPVKPEPPAELLAWKLPPLPTFVSPTDPAASSALTAEGERFWRAFLEDVRAWREAWLAYWAEK